jgi:hypothetical protein
MDELIISSSTLPTDPDGISMSRIAESVGATSFNAALR